MRRIGLAASEEKSFENVHDDGRTGAGHLHIRAFDSGELTIVPLRAVTETFKRKTMGQPGLILFTDPELERNNGTTRLTR